MEAKTVGWEGVVVGRGEGVEDLMRPMIPCCGCVCFGLVVLLYALLFYRTPTMFFFSLWLL